MRIHRNPFLLSALLALSCSSAGSDPVETDGFPSDLDRDAALEAEGVLAGTGIAEARMQDPQEDPRAVIQARQEKQRLLSQQFVELGDAALERGDYRGALEYYTDAYQTDPDNPEARDGLRRAQAALEGQPFDWDSAENRILQEQMRWARERMRVEGLVNDGDRAMQRGDFSQAVESYTAADLALRISPQVASANLDRSLVQAKLQQAMAAASDAAEAERAAERAAAEAEARALEQAEQEYFQNRIQTLFSEANQAFTEGHYGDALEILEALLELDPRNEEAQHLQEIARDAWHEQRQRRTQTVFREEWKRTFEELRLLTTPPKGTIEYDKEYFREVVSKRKPLDQVTATTTVDPATAAIQNALDNTFLVPRFDDPIEVIAENLQQYTRVNFVVSRTVREDLDEDLKQIQFVAKNQMPVSSILKVIEDLTGTEGIRFRIANGVVNVVAAEEAQGGQVRRQYEVRDIIRKVADFPGQEINLSPSGGIDQIEEELPEKEATILTADELLEAIQETIEPDAWDDTATMSIDENGTMIVYAVPEIHARIRSLLEDLRKAANIMVEIQVRFLKVEDSFLQDIGLDFRGLGDDTTGGVPGPGDDFVFDDFGSDPGSPGSPGPLGSGNDSGVYFREASDNVNILARTEGLYDVTLGNDETLLGSGGLSAQWTMLGDTQLEMVLRAVEKSQRSEIVTEPTLMVYNTARANLTVANQVSYVGDFDVEIAQAAALADPIVRVAQDGVFLDVRPVVTADRRFTYIDVRPTVATLRRPIPTFQTSLGAGSPVTLQLPELELQKIRTRVLVPDGGTLMLGGLNVVEEQDLESGIPFLSQIPIVSFFFSRKGTYESYRKLIILLTARVVIPDEHEPSIEPGGSVR